MFISRNAVPYYLKKYPNNIQTPAAHARCPPTTTCPWPTATWPPAPTYTYRSNSAPHWSYSGIRGNLLVKIINGNRRLGYILAMGNCRRGLINGDKDATTKLVEVENFIQSRKLHMLCLVESDLHSQVSRYRRAQPLTTEDIQDKLGIPGYKIYLPATWE